MRTFGKALKHHRLTKRRTLREVGKKAKLSVSYISDIEQERRGAPELETVRVIQEFLEVEDNELVVLASQQRTKLPREITQRIQVRPQLGALLARADDLNDEQLDQLIKNIPAQQKEN